MTHWLAHKPGPYQRQLRKSVWFMPTRDRCNGRVCVFGVGVCVCVCLHRVFYQCQAGGGKPGKGRGFELEAFFSGQLPALRHHNWSKEK